MSADPRPLWWPPHLLGLGLIQAAYWVGVLQLWERQTFAEAVVDATVEPLFFLAESLPFVILLCWIPAFLAVRLVKRWPGDYRWLRITAWYAVFALAWVLAARLAWGMRHLLDHLD